MKNSLILVMHFTGKNKLKLVPENEITIDRMSQSRKGRLVNKCLSAAQSPGN